MSEWVKVSVRLEAVWIVLLRLMLPLLNATTDRLAGYLSTIFDRISPPVILLALPLTVTVNCDPVVRVPLPGSSHMVFAPVADAVGMKNTLAKIPHAVTIGRVILAIFLNMCVLGLSLF